MPYTSKIDPEDDIMTVAEFRECVAEGGFIDYDGFGHPAKDGVQDDDNWIKPSRLGDIPEDATHIVWYNR